MLIWILVCGRASGAARAPLHRIGRNIYAVGGNATAARLAGIPLNRYILGVYMLSGFVSALAGILLTARTGSGQPTSGSQGLELNASRRRRLAAVHCRAAREPLSARSSRSSCSACCKNGLIILDVNSFWQDIAQGGLLVIAVVIQQRRAGARGVGLPM